MLPSISSLLEIADPIRELDLPDVLEFITLNCSIKSDDKVQLLQRPHGFKKGHFTPCDDDKLIELVKTYGTDWRIISAFIGNHTPRQCRDRWNNYLDPSISLKPWTLEEEELLLIKYRENGPQWQKISSFFKGRSYNAVRNKYNNLSRKLQKMQNHNVKWY